MILKACEKNTTPGGTGVKLKGWIKFMRNYILNKETRKIELHFDKEEYNNLDNSLKKELRSAYLFSGKRQAWVSRSMNNHYRAIQVASKLGFEGEEVKGERLSYAEEVERQVEKAEQKQMRYEKYSDNAEKRAKSLQNELNSFHGDIAFFTQPIIRGHKGSEAFGKRRDKIFDRYNKGFEEYRKSEYFIEKSKNMQRVIDGKKFKNRVYLSNRIKECKKLIRQYEKHIISCEESNNNNKLEYWLEELEYTVDKLAYIENCLDAIGGVKYNSKNLKVGYEVLIRGVWEKVLKLNKITVESQPIEEHIRMFYKKTDYTEIQAMRIPQDYKVEEIKNPFNVNDIFTADSFGGDRIIRAYKVLKTTKKTVTIIQIAVDNNIPMPGVIIGLKESRRQIKESKINKGSIYICDDDYRLYKYNKDTN